MKKYRLFFSAVALALLLSAGLAFKKTASAASQNAASLTELNAALSNAGIDTIDITSSFSGVNSVVNITRKVRINGNGKTLTSITLNVSNTSNVVINNLKITSFTGAQANGVIIEKASSVMLGGLTVDYVGTGLKITDSTAVSISDLVITRCGTRALDIISASDMSTVFITGFVTSDNARVGALSAGSYLELRGTVSHGELISVPAGELGQIRNNNLPAGAKDKNISPDDKIALIYEYEKGQNTWVIFIYDSITRPYVRFEVTKADTKTYEYILVPYSVRGPVIDVFSIPAVVDQGTLINLNDVSVTDLRDDAASIVKTFAVKDAVGQAVPLDDNKFTATSAKYEVKCDAVNSYGNASASRYIYITVVRPGVVPPVIHIPFTAPQDFYVKESVDLSVIYALDKNNDKTEITFVVEMPDGKLVPADGTLTFAKAGVYIVHVTARDSQQNEASARLVFTALKGGETRLSNPYTPYIIAFSVVSGVWAAALFFFLLNAKFGWIKARSIGGDAGN